ncbi:hypothetical protein [Aurantiacibacter suaedae]|uniref:hypothetical protein n=1 Tax=Aurantiacibacter suaedae TaxID=2545755 RepID=UPI0010F94D22|nr:hypothetical protein [Aurantiacibacter suaedae]
MDKTYRLSRRAFGAGLLGAGIAGASPAQAQFGGLGNLVRSVTKEIGLDRVFGGDEPITTNLADAVWGNPALDGVDPPLAPAQMTSLERTAEGGFVLQPGYWQFTAQSYCLHAGTHGPGGGDGYLYAPLEGSREEAIRDILRNSVQNPQIEQHDIQTLIWAILARAKFEDLSNEHKLVAAQLLSQRQLATLNRSALDLVPSGAMSSLMGEVPAPLRTVFRAEAELRNGLAGGASYSELESIAVLTGAVPLGEGSIAVPAGRWSDHPDGYRIRFYPSGYSRTEVHIWCEDGSAGVGKAFDPSVQVAVPGNTARQRLAQSGRERV